MPQDVKLMDHLYIKIGGNDLSAEAMNDLVEVTVDSSLHYPDMFTITLHDEKLKWMGDDTFSLGKEVEISALPEAGGRSQPLIKGEITALEPDFGLGTQALFLVRGYDRSHRLQRGTHSQAYLQMTDSDIAQRIAKDAGLKAQVDPTSEVYDHIIQNNLTHMDFLVERARRIGYELFVDDKTLYFRKPQPSNGQPLELEWGMQLRSFRPRMTLVEQVDEVIVKGWNPKNRQAIVGQAQRGRAEPHIGNSQSGSEMASSAFSSARQVVVDRLVNSQAEADTLAQALLDEISGALLEAEGVCIGQPELRAGKTVKLTSLGGRFSGTYLVAEATHIYRAEGGYTTTFRVNGRRPESLASLITDSAQVQSRASRPAPVVGIVTNNKDPEERGRVKVKFPWLTDEVESDWARLVAPGAGSDRGLYCLPEVNDEVLVVFEHGDINEPYVLGGLWNGQDKPPLPNSKALANGKVHQRIFKTRAGHTLTFTDDSEDGVVIETAGGHRLTLADQKKQVKLETSGGQVLTLNDQSSEITLQSNGNLTIKSGGNLSVEATGSLSLKGATFSLSGNATGEVKAGATLEVKGALVKIN